MSRDLKFLNAFNSIPGVGSATLRAIKNNFGTYEEAWHAGDSALHQASLNPLSLRAILWKRASLNPDKEMEKLIRDDIWLVTEEDKNYPPLLKEISNAPVALYGRGNIKALFENPIAVAIVGTRRPTHYGLEVAEKIPGHKDDTAAVVYADWASGSFGIKFTGATIFIRDDDFYPYILRHEWLHVYIYLVNIDAGKEIQGDNHANPLFKKCAF